MTGDDLHLIQYTDLYGGRYTTVLCPTHRSQLMASLRKEATGSTGKSVPSSLFSCDACEMLKGAP